MKQKIKKFTKRVTESICGAGAFMVVRLAAHVSNGCKS